MKSDILRCLRESVSKYEIYMGLSKFASDVLTRSPGELHGGGHAREDVYDESEIKDLPYDWRESRVAREFACNRNFGVIDVSRYMCIGKKFSITRKSFYKFAFCRLDKYLLTVLKKQKYFSICPVKKPKAHEKLVVRKFRNGR